MQRLLSKREKAVLFSTIAVVLFSIVFNILVMPVVEKNNSLNKEIAYTRAKLKKYLSALKPTNLMRLPFFMIKPKIQISPLK